VREFTHKTLYVDIEKITVWPPFVADSEAPTCTPWNGSEPFRLGTLGRLHLSKQYPILLKAFARAREIGSDTFRRLELHIAGDGPEEPALRALVRSLDLEPAVHFAGFVEEPGNFLARLHGYIQTSFKEGFCIAAHEAMQAALPVISTRVGELAYSVHPGQTGWLCDVGDVDAVARAMIDLARDPIRAAQMGRSAREWLLQKYSAGSFRAVGERLLGRVQTQLATRAARPTSCNS
jgi:glycosyltransferase involved in cell wall biosynthesis